MNVVGLITEYNPFHNGHKYHIEKAKELSGADYVVVVMSGNFVQRGTPAIVDKYTRTSMALSCGADLVIELPTVYATASAELFAFGAISVLDSLGFVDSICFGSECGDIVPLSILADCLLNESDSYKQVLSKYMKKGEPYPIARKHALLDEFPTQLQPKMEEILSSPNNILGIEYIKAIKRLNSPIIPLTIKRTSANYHKEDFTGTISSASSIRKNYLVDSDTEKLIEQLPKEAFHYFKNAEHKSLPIHENDFSNLLYYKLLYTPRSTLTEYMDLNEELVQRIYNKLDAFKTYEEFAMELKSRNVTLTRINRALLHILLDIRNEDLFDILNSSGVHSVKPCPYIRLLGMKKTATHLIKKSSIEPKVPILTKVADAKTLLSRDGLSMLELDIKATHLYNQICFLKFAHSIPNEYRHGCVIL